MSSKQFELSTPIKYNPGGGQDIEASFIELNEPTGKVSHLCCQIESLIQSGLLSMSKILDSDTIEDAKQASIEAKKANKDKKIDEIEGPDPEAVLSMMSSGGVEMNKVVLLFRELFCVVGLIGGEKPLTKPRLDAMTHKDFKNMMGFYAANFILT